MKHTHFQVKGCNRSVDGVVSDEVIFDLIFDETGTEAQAIEEAKAIVGESRQFFWIEIVNRHDPTFEDPGHVKKVENGYVPTRVERRRPA